MSLDSSTPVANPSRPDRGGPLRTTLNHLRSDLDGLAEGLEGPGGVNLFAVLLLHLRLALAARLGSSLGHGRLLAARELFALVSWCLPWREPENHLRCRAGWPTLLEKWAALEAECEAGRQGVSVALLCRTLTNLLNGQATVTLDQWHHWFQLARQQARSRLGEEVWRRSFAEWLPGKHEGEPSGGPAS